MSLHRHMLVALLIGLTLLVSPALLLQFQDPAECANSVAPATEAGQIGEVVPVHQYDGLSPNARRALDRAQSADGSGIVYGEQCPEEFSYTADQHRYEIVKDGSRYVLTTYANDLIPEVPIAASIVAFLGVTLIGIGFATSNDPETQFPVWIGAVSLVTLAVVTAAVVLDQKLWVAIGGASLVTVITLVGSGVALRARRALLLGGAVALLSGIVSLPLTGMSLVFFLPAVLPLFLVGIGVGGRAFTTYVQRQARSEAREQ